MFLNYVDALICSMTGGDLQSWRRLLLLSFFIGFGWITFTRKTFPVLMLDLISDLKWREEDVGATSSCFVVGFVLSQIAFSTMPESINLRWVYSGCLLGSCVTVILLGVLHQGLVSFAALWLVHGFFQGFSWPSIVEMTNKWFPPNERGKILAFGGVGGNLAGVCSPALFRVLSMSFGGWRGTFIITGLSGVVISVILAVITRASPMDVNNDKGQNNAHLKFNKKEKISRSSADRVFANSLLWVCVLSTLVLTLSKIFMSDWMQLYFVQDKKWQPEKVMMAMGTFEAGGVIGTVLAGVLADFVMKKFPHLKSYARLPIFIGSCLLAMVLLHLLRDSQPNHTLYIIAIAFALGLSLYGSSPLFGIVATEIAPPGFERRSYAVIELATQVGCFLAGFPISFLIIAYKWRTTIWILEISVLLLAIVNIVSLTFHVRTKQVKVE